MMSQGLSKSKNVNSWEEPSAGHKCTGNAQWGPDLLISQSIRATCLTTFVPELSSSSYIFLQEISSKILSKKCNNKKRVALLKSL